MKLNQGMSVFIKVHALLTYLSFGLFKCKRVKTSKQIKDR